MLRCIDGQNFDIQLGDTFRFPTSFGDFGRCYPYTQKLCNILNRTWEVIALEVKVKNTVPSFNGDTMGLLEL